MSPWSRVPPATRLMRMFAVRLRARARTVLAAVVGVPDGAIAEPRGDRSDGGAGRGRRPTDRLSPGRVGKHWCCCTGSSAMAGPPGLHSWTICRTSSPSWPGTPRRRAIGAAAGLVSHRRLRRLPGGIHSAPPTRSTAPGRTVLRRHRGPGAVPPTFDPPAHVGARRCLRRVGRLAACRRSRRTAAHLLKLAALPPDQFAAAMLSSMFSESAPADSVARFAVSVREFNIFWSCYYLVVGRGGPPRHTCHRRCAYPAVVRRPGCACPIGRSARPPGRDPGIHIDRLARHRAYQSGRGARAVQPQGPRVPPA